MDIGNVNREVDFCKVYDMETKERIESILLRNRISYYVQWEDKGIWQKFFFARPRQKVVCMFRIHSDELTRAKELVKPVLGTKMKDLGGKEK